MNLKWVRDLQDRCNGAGTPFFFKQFEGPRKWETGLNDEAWAQHPNTADKATLTPK
jgi:protein gp37